MDIGILARIIQEIQSDESKFDFQTTFQSILTALTGQVQETIEAEQLKLRDNLGKSIQSGYVKTDHEALETLGVEDYFGLGSFVKLESILSLSPLPAQDSLTKYIAERLAAISKIEALRSSLSSFGLQPRVLAEDEYEIGFSFPDRYKDIGKFNKALSDINNFLNELSAAKTQGPFKISYVSNGTIQIFLHAGAQLARDFNLVAEHIVTICGFYHIAKETTTRVQDYAAARQTKIKAEIDGQRQDDIDASVDDLITSLDIKNGVDRNHIKRLFVGLVNHIGEGVFAEVRAPALTEPAKLPDSAPPAEKKVFEEKLLQYQTKLMIEKTNKEIYLLEQDDIKGSVKLLSDKLADNGKKATK